MTPFLILVLGARPLVAVGTDLTYGAVTKLFGALLHWRQGTVDMRIVRRLALGSVPAGLLAVVALNRLPSSTAAADEVVRTAIGGVLMLVAVVMLFQLFGARLPPLSDRWRTALQGRGTTVVGALVGALVGLTSVGSGSLLVPFLVGAFPLSAARVVGTDVFHAAILVSVTALGHAQGGSVDWMVVGGLLMGSIPGVAVGSWLAPRTPARLLRGMLALLLLATGFTLV